MVLDIISVLAYPVRSRLVSLALGTRSIFGGTYLWGDTGTSRGCPGLTNVPLAMAKRKDASMVSRKSKVPKIPTDSGVTQIVQSLDMPTILSKHILHLQEGCSVSWVVNKSESGELVYVFVSRGIGKHSDTYNVVTIENYDSIPTLEGRNISLTEAVFRVGYRIGRIVGDYRETGTFSITPQRFIHLAIPGDEKRPTEHASLSPQRP